MKESFPKAFAGLLVHEGGFSNHPVDPGGMTNLGVTKRVWEAWVGHPVTEQEMRALTPATVSLLYRMNYWAKIKGDNLPVGVDYCVFDAAVNSGVSRAARWLQIVAGLEVDGVIGPVTLTVVNGTSTKKLIEEYSAQRLAFLKLLPTWGTFGKGWERRVKEVKETALSM